MSNKMQHVQIGNVPVQIVPIGNFSRLGMKELEMAWQVVGPSAAKNLNCAPIWEVIAAAYCEGLNHGAEITKSKLENLKS